MKSKYEEKQHWHTNMQKVIKYYLISYQQGKRTNKDKIKRQHNQYH